MRIIHGINLKMDPKEKYIRYKKCYERLAKQDLDNELEKSRPARLKRTADFIKKFPCNIILDIGCADCKLLNRLNCYKVGVDLSLPYLKRALGESNLILSDAGRLPLRNETFDAVICSCLLEHVLNPEDVIKEIKRVLKKGGKAFIVIPWEEDISVYKNMPYEFAHLRSFDEKSLMHLFSGFSILAKIPVCEKDVPSSDLCKKHPNLYKYARVLLLTLWYVLPFYFRVHLFGCSCMLVVLNNLNC